MIVKGNREDILHRLKAMNPILFEILPLTLEEAFTCKLESHGVNTLSKKIVGGVKK
jgi:ABC-2 type transport system ATP-binding protein